MANDLATSVHSDVKCTGHVQYPLSFPPNTLCLLPVLQKWLPLALKPQTNRRLPNNHNAVKTIKQGTGLGGEGQLSEEVPLN